jgi:hypothetical protein
MVPILVWRDWASQYNTMTRISSYRPQFEYSHADTKHSSGLSPEDLFTIHVPNFNGWKSEPWTVTNQTAKDSTKR